MIETVKNMVELIPLSVFIESDEVVSFLVITITV